ncbi:hypothetical protein M758_4G261600 [Ceratodon purpureus]|nr:hypothetical protein M758_4G261600 [Ceratodon purpureus]KAG0621010.1 hypothetical protein M758_4G261600 [Ceratodon purpureus]KAG0621011.1 hypothetical protein M758_4G261600 [Ceratodon purpureus]KAG0621012.1 hypothetical protein M758_4G261600 [Ceratodon purpureus]KAG0621013.1 hypothetical protein M758_4G261600 [Ceratodon purpureus]
MDKGKSKTDLRAAGKKRLEEFRQKRQQKGGSTKSSNTTALKALTESEQNPGDHVAQEISRNDSLPNEEARGSSSGKEGKPEFVVDQPDEVVKPREEHHEVVVPSPSSSLTSPIQRLKVGGHLGTETSEQSVESPCEPGSSNGNSLDDKDREAVYTILWENHGTDHPQRNEEWQERSFDGREDLDERVVDQGNYSTFRVDGEHYGSESKEGVSTQRKLSGNLVDAVDKFHASEGIKEWDEHSSSLASSQQRPVHDEEADECRRDVSSVDPCFKKNSLFSNEESIEQRMLLPERTEKLEKEKADMVSEIALLLQKLEQIVEESGREREFHENEISSLKTQVREKDEAVSTRDALLEELEAVRTKSEEKLRTALDSTEKEKEQLNMEYMGVKAQVERLAEERDKFLSTIDVHEKNLETLRADSANLAAQMDCVSQEKDQLSTELCAAREQAAEALEHEAQLLRSLKELDEERESERTRLQKLQVQLEDILSEKMQLEVRLCESNNVLEELRVVNKQVSDELALSEQERRMMVTNAAEERSVLTDRIKTMEDEQLKFHALVENLTHRLSMYEENEETSEALIAKVKSSDEECKRLELVVKNLGTSLQSLDDEKTELGSKFRDLQVEKEELITEVEVAKNELKVAQSQLEFFRIQQSEIVEELTSVKLELNKELADKTKLQLDEEESRQKLERLEEQFGKHEIERSEVIESFVQKLQLAEENIKVLEEQRVSLEEESASAKHELGELKERMSKVDVDKAELEENSGIAIKALEQQVRRLNVGLSELEEQCQILTVELQLSNEKVDTLEAERVEMKGTAELLHQKAMVLEDRNSELDQLSNGLIEERDRLTSELGSSQRTLETVLEEKVQLESELRFLQEEVLKTKEEKTHIRSDCETLQEKLNEITTEKESVVYKLKESQEDLQKMSEESKSVTSELSLVMKKLDESTDLKNKLVGDLQSLQAMLQGTEEVKARIEIELEESLLKLNDSLQERTLLSTKLDTVHRSVQVLEIEKMELASQVQQLQEAVNQRDEEISISREERKQCEVDYSAKVEIEVAKSHGLATEICNLEAELQTLEQQLAEPREQMHDNTSDEACSPTADKGSENMTIVDFENASPRSHAANMKLVKKLVEVFEGKVTEDVPIQNQRGLMSPVAEFFMQAQAMKKSSDDLQRERDSAILAESNLRADVDALTMKLHDINEERVTLQALVEVLQGNLETATADCIHFNQTIDKLMNGDGEGVKMVAVLEGDKVELQAQNLEFAEKLRAAEVSIQSMLVDQALKQDLQQRSEELDTKLQSERAALEKMLNGVDLLSNYIEEHVLTMISELEWTSGSSDAVSQVEYKLALLVERILPELVLKAHTLEEERDLARQALDITTGSINELQAERMSLISEKEILKAEMEEKMTNETQARVEYEGQIRALTSSLEEAGNELKLFKNERTGFEKKLLMVVTKEFPGHIKEPAESVENAFDFCWFLVEAMLEGTSKKVQDVRMELSHANTELNDLLALERLQHQASILDVEAGRDVLQQEKNELSEKVKFLEEERRRLQEEEERVVHEKNELSEKVKSLEEERMRLREEEERVVHEWQDLLESETKTNLVRQEKIQMLESTVDDLQRGLEERKEVEAGARSVHERDMKLLNLTLQSIQSELDKVRDAHIHFDEKLECAAREVLPTIEVKTVDFEDNHFDYSWTIVNLILEEYSRKLQHAYADVTELENKLNTGKEEEIRGLQELQQKITEELAVAKAERDVAQSELAQSEKRLASTKERLTLAINKGKSIVVQRDAVKATLAEKTGELQRVVSEHKEVMQFKDIALQEAQAEILTLKVKADQAEVLKVEIAEARNTSERLEKSLFETRSALSDLETAVDKINLVADGMPETSVAKIDWVAAKLKDLQMRLSYFENKAESLIVDLTTVSNEKEVVLQKLHNATLECMRLEKISDENALNIAALKSEIEDLQEMIAIMKAEAAQHMKVQHAVSKAMGVLEVSGRDFEADPAVSNLLIETELDAAVTFHVNKYKSAVHELDELRKQSSSLRDAIEKLEGEKAFVSAEKLQSLEAILLARDTELRDTIVKLEGATRVISEKDEETKAYVEQNERLKEELIRCKEDLGMLNSNFSIAEKRMLALMNELQEVVDSFQSTPEEGGFQVEEVTRSMNEMVMEVNSLVKTVIEQTNRREIELHDANQRATAALVLELNTAKELLAKLELEFLDFRNVAQGLSWLNRSAPSSSSLLDWVTWLIDSLQEEHQTAERALQEIESLTKTAEEKSLEVQRLQGKSDSLFVELSNQQHQKETLADELRQRDLELQIVEDKVQKLADNNVALESEVESLRSKDHVESALMGIENIVENTRLQGRPSSTSSPTEWISWLILAFQEEQEKVSQAAQEAETFKRTADALTLQVEEANDKYSSLSEEHLIQKDENGNLQNKLRELYDTFNVERDSLKSEIQALRNSSLEITSREFEFAEAHRTVTNLQEALAFKDEELSELRNEIEDLSLRYTQQDLKLQSLMEERKRLSSKLVEVEAERNNLQTEMAEAANEKSNFQSDINQFEQKLVAVREKLNLAIKKGKGLEKQRDSLKQLVAEETAKVESMVLSHRKEIHLKDSELLETRAQAKSMDTRVQELQAEIMSLHKIATTSQQRMQTERQRLESAFSGIEIPKDVQSRDPLEKVEWLVSLLEGTRNTTQFLEGELDNSRNALETLESELRDTEKRLQSVSVENFKAQETISLWVKKAEEAESRATFDREQYESEIDGLARALKEADIRQQAALSHAKDLENTLEKQQNTINASEAARTKIVSKLTFTRNKLNLLVQQSQELVRECESLHKSLQERNAEIAELNHEIARLKNIQVELSQNMDAGSEASSRLTLLQEELARTSEKSAATVKELRELLAALQRVVEEKDTELEGVRRKLEDILLKGDNVLWMEHNIINQNKGDDGLTEIDVQSMNGSQNLASVITALGQRFDNLVSDAQMYRSNSDKKEAQIQKLRNELHDSSVEKASLQAGVKAKTMEIERLQTEVNTNAASVGGVSSAQSEIEELGSRSNWAGPGNPATPHVRGPRRPVQAEVAIDMENEDSSHLLLDLNDKEHGFSALTNSRLVPKATRILADKLDGLWFAGGRILTRQPSARLGLAMYWILIHVYMATIFSRVIL